ncbi:AraC family transcriptional regulator [Paenibacillus sp. GSMTC-2017]|nr:AraC family transcriptional regulator [Paenibacillus sp. GSMTC-2017]
MTVSREASKDGLVCYEITFEVIHLDHNDIQHSKTEYQTLFPYVGEVDCSPFSQCLKWVEALFSDNESETSLCAELFLLNQQILFQQLIYHILKQNVLDTPMKSSRQAVESTIKQLSLHYNEDWSVSKLAEHANVGRWQYSRLFKQITGQVPLQYLSSIRIDQAKHLLQVTNDRLFDIAINVGFDNEFYFNRRFKQSVGLSPGQYRRHYREEIQVFAPFLEDFLVTLGVTPILQSSYMKRGTQTYLGIDHIPSVDLSEKSPVPLPVKPDLILVDYGFSVQQDNHRFNEWAPLYQIPTQGEDWQESLRIIADLIGRGKSALITAIISDYERKAESARKKLRTIRNQTTAFIRVRDNGIFLYGGPDMGCTGPILYRDLELTPPSIVLELTRNTRHAELTDEMLAKVDADNLFVTFDNPYYDKSKLYASSAWRSIPAVSNKRVSEVDFFSWMNYGILSHNKKIDDVLRTFEQYC